MLSLPRVIFSDFDGTLTHGQNLTSDFFSILKLAEKNSIPFIIVTGRSKSWGHFFLSHFETLCYVITEGGGVLSTKNSLNGHARLFDELLIDDKEVSRLENVTKDLKKLFPGIELSVDSFGRQTDRAIELSWLEGHQTQFDEIKSFFKGKGVNWSTSNVHMNFWCGEISKSKSMKWLLKEKLDLPKEQSLFFGDSLNDESVFKEFPHTVGVSNLSLIEDSLTYHPSITLRGKDKEGSLGVLHYLSSLLK